MQHTRRCERFEVPYTIEVNDMCLYTCLCSALFPDCTVYFYCRRTNHCESGGRQAKQRDICSLSFTYLTGRTFTQGWMPWIFIDAILTFSNLGIPLGSTDIII